MSLIADYESDILEWSERQAAALRHLAETRRDLPNELDWENIAEEIESVGRSEFRAVNGYVRQIFIHLIKAISLPDAPTLPHWRKEVGNFRDELLESITPSMRARIDLRGLWAKAIEQAKLDLAAYGELIFAPLAGECPLSVDDILDPNFVFLATVANVRRRLENR